MAALPSTRRADSTSPWTSNRWARILDEDPDLVGDPAPALAARLRQAAVAPVVSLGRGPVGSALPHLEQGSFGFLVLDGVLSCGMRLSGRLTLELLGETDLLRPGSDGGPSGEMSPNVEFAALERCRLAVLDAGFARRTSWAPIVASSLMGRAVLRARRLHLEAAVRGLPLVDERLLLMLWHFAERWGRMTSRGVSLSLRVTHQQLADIVGAQRPTVSLHIGALRDRGLIDCPGRGEWVLHGSPPPALWQLYEQAGLSAAGVSTPQARHLRPPGPTAELPL